MFAPSIKIISRNAGRRLAFTHAGVFYVRRFYGITLYRCPNTPCIRLMAIQHFSMNVIDSGTGSGTFCIIHYVTIHREFQRRTVYLLRNVRPRNGHRVFIQHQLPALLHSGRETPPPCFGLRSSACRPAGGTSRPLSLHPPHQAARHGHPLHPPHPHTPGQDGASQCLQPQEPARHRHRGDGGKGITKLYTGRMPVPCADFGNAFEPL